QLTATAPGPVGDGGGTGLSSRCVRTRLPAGPPRRTGAAHGSPAGRTARVPPPARPLTPPAGRTPPGRRTEHRETLFPGTASSAPVATGPGGPAVPPGAGQCRAAW